MDVFQQAIEESRKQFEKQLEAKRKKELQKEKELQQKKEEELKKKREEQKKKKQQEEEKARIEREAKLKEEYDKLCNEKNQHLKSQNDVSNDFSMTMKSIFTREVEFQDGTISPPDQSQNQDCQPPSHQQIDHKDQKFTDQSQNYQNLNSMLYDQEQEDIDQSVMSSGIIIQRKFITDKIISKDKEQKIDQFDKNFSKTEKMEADNYGGQLNIRASEQLISNPLLGRQTAPESFSQFKNQMEDLQKNNFMNSQQITVHEDQKELLSEKISWEQKQLLILEKQQNELQLKLLKMQQEFQQDQQKQGEKHQNEQNKIQDWFVEESEQNKNEDSKLKNEQIELQVQELCNDIQKEQEQIIKQIVLQSAVQTVKNESDDEQVQQVLSKSIKGAGSDQFIKSICNTSGIFIKEFREIKDDPYAREEFIMSISHKSAVFDQIIQQQQEHQSFQNTAKSSIKNMDSSNKQKKDMSAAGNRKLKLMYDLEVNGKIKQIQYKQIKQKEQEEQHRLKIGQNLFAQLVGQQIENQKIEQNGKIEPVTFSKQVQNEDSDNFSEEIERESKDEELKMDETIEDSAMFSAYDNVPEIEDSTGTFGDKQNLQLHLNLQPQQNNNSRQLLSARPPIDQNKPKINKNSNYKFRPVSGFSNLTKDSIPTRSGMDTSSASSFARKTESENAQQSQINQAFSSYKNNAQAINQNSINYNAQNKDILTSIMNEPSYDFDGVKQKQTQKQNNFTQEISQMEDENSDDDRDDDTQFDLDNVSVSLAGKTNKTAINNSSFDQEIHQVYTKDDLKNYQLQIEQAIKQELERIQLQKSNNFGDSTFKRDGDTRFLKQLDYTYSNENPYEHSFNEKHATTELESRDSNSEFTNTQRSRLNQINDKTLGLDDVVESMDDADDRRQQLEEYQLQSEEKYLDPAPKTAQAQARYFYYETDEANISMKSKDFDNIYQHGRTDQLEGLITTDIKKNVDSQVLDESDLIVDKDELTFGSRPATAQHNNNDLKSSQSQFKSVDPDNSFVNMGQITLDRKNNILGNKFQNPNDNQHSPIQKQAIKQLKYEANDLEKELEELKRQNEEILKQIEKQKKQNYSNMDNIEIGKDYMLEETLNIKHEEESSNKDEYEEDQFEQEQSDDEFTLTELQRQRINDFSKSNMQQKMMDSQIPINKEDRSPRQNEKNNYYDCLDESNQLKLKQSMQDPLKQFYMNDSAEQDNMNDIYKQFGVKDNESDTYSNDSTNQQQKYQQNVQKLEKRKQWQQKQEQTDNSTQDKQIDQQLTDQKSNQLIKQPVLIDLNDEQSNTIKQEKLKRFEEFKLKRELAEEKRKNKANEKRQKSKQPNEIIEKSEPYTKNIPQTQQVSDSSKIKDLIASPSDFFQNKNIPKPNINGNFRIQSATRTPGLKSDQKQMPKGFKGIIPSQNNIKEQVQPFKARQDSSHRIQQQLNQVRQKQRTPNNWVNEKTSQINANNEYDNEGIEKYYFNDEESKYDKEAQNEGIKLPPIIPSTPSIQQIKSIAAPSIVPRKAMVKNSNKKLIRLALQLVVLAGQTELAIRERQEVLAVIDATDYEQYVILFKGQTGRFDFRALYAVKQDEDQGQILSKIYGQTTNLSPLVIQDEQIDKFLKYNSGQKTFIETGGQKSLTMTVDAIILKKVKK